MTDTAGPVLILDRDLFFAIKVREPLKQTGREVIMVKSVEDLQSRLAADPRPACLAIHIGLQGSVASIDWQGAIAAAHAAGVPVMAYGPHVDIAAQTAAREAGATRVIPHSKLSGDVVAQIDETIARRSQSAGDHSP